VVVEAQKQWGRAGESIGVMVWCVKNKWKQAAPAFGMELCPPESHGIFHTDRCYLVLDTSKSVTGEKVHHLHYWLGSQASMDQPATVGILATHLDQFLRWGHATCHHHRHEEGHENDMFLHIFGEKYHVAGASKSSSEGLRQPEAAHWTSRLFVVQSSLRHAAGVSVQECDSFQPSGLHILDMGPDIYQVHSTMVTPWEKFIGHGVAKHIHSERGGKPRLHIIEDRDLQQPRVAERVASFLAELPNMTQSADNMESKDSEDVASRKKAQWGAMRQRAHARRHAMQETQNDMQQHVMQSRSHSVRKQRRGSGWNMDLEPHLLRVHTSALDANGPQQISVQEHSMRWESLDDASVFILDAGLQIFVLQGLHCNPWEKCVGASVAQELRDEPHRISSIVSILDTEDLKHGGDVAEAFGLLLGRFGRPVPAAKRCVLQDGGSHPCIQKGIMHPCSARVRDEVTNISKNVAKAQWCLLKDRVSLLSDCREATQREQQHRYRRRRRRKPVLCEPVVGMDKARVTTQQEHVVQDAIKRGSLLCAAEEKTKTEYTHGVEWAEHAKHASTIKDRHWLQPRFRLPEIAC